jgi:hypothetical protein
MSWVGYHHPILRGEASFHLDGITKIAAELD